MVDRAAFSRGRIRARLRPARAGHRLPRQPIVLAADPNRLAQVFSKLLNNSAKYARDRGNIWLSAERQESDVVVTVKDDGIGIPFDMQPRIFEMFTQIDRSESCARCRDVVILYSHGHRPRCRADTR